MDMDDFWLLWKGFNEKVEYELELVRRQTAIIYYSQPNYGKGNRPSFERVWPSGKKKTEKSSLIEKARLALKKHREEDALRQWKEKNGANTKNRG